MIPYQNTDRSVTVVLTTATGTEVHNLLKGDNGVAEQALDLLTSETHDEALVERLNLLLNPVSTLSNLDDERVTIDGRTVLFDGEGVPSALTWKLLTVAREGLDLKPWKRFVVRLFQNPNRAAQAELNEFLEAGNLPITEDGCFLAYKRVRHDYSDCHSGKFDNSVGQVVEMPRSDVDGDRTRTCSRGLHFCSQEYLKHFYGGSGRIVVVKVDPADVVSIPIDYNYTKGRTWRYEVVGEVDVSTEDVAQEWGVYNFDFDAFDSDYEEWDDPLDYEDEDEDDPFDGMDEDEEASDEVMSDFGQVYAPATKPSKFSSWWNKNFGR